MATDLTLIRDQLKTNMQNLRTPTAYTDSDYLEFVVLGCKRFYRDTGIEANWSTEYTSGASPTLSRTLDLNEDEYCLVSSEIELIKNVIMYWSTMVSYTTNALTISNAFKPFDFMKSMIKDREAMLVDLFYKMTDTSNMSEIDTVTVEPVEFDYDNQIGSTT
jgi:hypothetical protein